MKALRIIIALTLLGFAIMLGINLQMPKTVLSVVGGQYAFTELRLYDDGSFTIEVSYFEGRPKKPFETSPTDHYAGLYVVKADRVLLYADSKFDASQEAAKLSRFRGQERIKFESRKHSYGTQDIAGEHEPKWFR